VISRVFIRRPILACVVSAFIVIAGLAALHELPVAQLPDILPPQVNVYASYPGASAQAIAATVAAPLEQEINGVEGMLYMNSVSAGDGSIAIAVTFATGTNADLATINVNNRIQAALPRLPEEVRRQGVYVTKSAATFLGIFVVYATDGRYAPSFMSDYVLRNVLDEIKRIPGVGDVQNFATRNYSIRIWIKPDKLAQLGLTPSDVVTAVREQNSQFAAGAVGREPLGDERVDFTFSVTADGRFSEPEQFENIILKTTDAGAVIRLKDVARVELGSQRYDFDSKFNGMDAVPVGIALAPGANALQVGDAVRARMDELALAFPPGMKWTFPYDTTRFIRVSIGEVVKTLVEAMILVFGVVLLFLQNWRATLIPALAVPVSLIGTMAAMYVFGFSLNTLTLFGIVLSIGIVVDDAIIVLENVERIMADEGLDSRAATVKAMSQVTGPVIAIVLVLTSVFTPVAFLGGLVGEMYRQFAVTIAVSVTISGFVALTLTPALCSWMLRREDVVHHGLLQRFNEWFVRMTGRYTHGVSYVLKHNVAAFVVFAVMTVSVFGLYRMIPTTLAPNEDQGYIIAIPMLPDASALSRTVSVNDELTRYVRKNSAIDNTVSFSGFDPLNNALRSNVGAMWVSFKPWDERKGKEQSLSALLDYASRGASNVKDAFVVVTAPPPISGISQTGGFEAYIQARADQDPKALQAATQKLVDAASKRPELTGVSTTYSANIPQLRIDVDREKAKLLGIDIDQVFTTLQSTFGAYYVNDFNRSGRVFQVQLQSEARYRARPENIRDVYLRARGGDLVPLSAVASVTEVTGPETVLRFNVFPSAFLIGGPSQGHSSGEALKLMEQLAHETLPPGYTLAWSGSYLQEKLSGGAATGMFFLGVLMVFLILAAQYERWTLPLAVILTVPFGVFGALLAVWLRGLQNDIYFQIGLITLVGLSAKNAILIVEFAMLKYAEGKSLDEAATEAAKLRFRPIVMTSAAFIFGVLPLAIGSGAGSASRHSIGTGVIGGMLAATLIATLFTPLFFKFVAGFRRDKTAEAAQSLHHRSEDSERA